MEKKKKKTSQGGGDNLKKFHLKNGNKKKFYVCLFSISERELEFFSRNFISEKKNESFPLSYRKGRISSFFGKLSFS